MTLAHRLRALLVFLSCAPIAYSQSPSTSTGSPLTLDPFPVAGTRLPTADLPQSPALVVIEQEFIERSGATSLSGLLELLPQTYAGSGSGVATVPNGSPSYGNARAIFNFSTGSAASINQSGVSSVGLRGLGASGTLVLIDGRRVQLATQGDTANDTSAGFYDLSSIPLGMVERIEVLADGGSAVHGSDAIGGVVNVVLRRNYTGSELTAGIRSTQEGGGFERHATLSTGIIRDSLSLSFSASARSREALKASQREFSASQNLTDRGGRDHRLIVGSPAIISGPFSGLNGLTDQNGDPARYAVVPAGQDGSNLSPGDFEGRGGFSPSRIRFFDAANYRDLIGAEDHLALRGTARYDFSENLQGYFSLNWSQNESEMSNEPPSTSGGGFGGTDSTVPASDPRNPFGQNVQVTLVHVESPARAQFVDIDTVRATAGLRGTFLENWEWDAAATLSRENFDSRTIDLDEDAFIAALADGSFNPWGDPLTNGPLNAHLYAELLESANITGDSQITSFDATVRGPVFTMTGGDALLAIGAETLRAERDRESTNPRFGQPAEIESSRTSSAAYAELYLPLFNGDTAGANHLSARFAARYESADKFTETSPQASVTWQPISAITLHASYGKGFRAPSLTELEKLERSRIDDINDPQMGGANYDVAVINGGNLSIQAEHSKTYQFGVTIEPPFIEGLRLRALTHETYYDNKINELGPQTFVDFADQFPGRVTRDGSGTVTQVNATTINFGQVYTHSLDVGLSYSREFAATGRWLFQADAIRQLDYRLDERPDRTADLIADGVDTASPPKWGGFASLLWNKGNWDATIMARYTSAFESNGSGPFFDQFTSIPSWTTVDLRVGYQFEEDIWRGFGKGLHVQMGVSNIADKQPPFANTVWGYNQNLYSPLGRTYDLTIRLPF